MSKREAYEYLKAAWLAKNISASPAETKSALQEIARRVGL